MAIVCNETAGFQVLAAVEAPALALEGFQQPVDPCAPVLGAEHQHEVVAAYVADEVAARVDPFAQALCQAQQDLVAAGVAVEIVLRICEFPCTKRTPTVC